MSEQAPAGPAGGCVCGEVRYRMSRSPLFVHCCHCSYCQRQSGSAFAVNAMIESSSVELLSGRLDSVQTPTPGGKGQVVFRCSRCRTAVWSTYGGAGEILRFVRVGTLDDPDSCPPDIHIYTSTRRSWVRLPDDLPAMEGYYNRNEQWPPESQDRLNRLLGR